ncbi:MAG: hypothetical protein L0G94_17120 [Brachybacterium sp.]|uniref:hypothetical protein n=1 Tax=Brachybacterium sp. TaxID=1891286 RepID=UPI002648DBF8|nr:hypothetical protein [Brachybacterium sp.]MDN5688380.1 hypothetical protein [Brachybacterium sp.]
MSLTVTDPARFIVEADTAAEAAALLHQLAAGVTRPDLSEVDQRLVTALRELLVASMNRVDITVVDPGHIAWHELHLGRQTCLRVSSAPGTGTQLEAFPLASLLMMIARTSRWRPGAPPASGQTIPQVELAELGTFGYEPDGASALRDRLVEAYGTDEIDWGAFALRRRSRRTERDEICRAVMLAGQWAIEGQEREPDTTSLAAWRAFISPVAAMSTT